MLRWSWLGRVPYRPAVALMERIRDRVIAGEAPGHLLFLEHEPTITLGRSADAAHVVDARGFEVVASARGGDVTAHGPGQLVIYPVVPIGRGLVAFIEAVGGAIVDELAARGVAAELRRRPAGVWIGDAKVAALGLHVRHRVAAHGFALNVDVASLALFDGIVPCGLSCGAVTALALHAPAPALPALAASLADRIARALGRALEPRATEIRP
jgi:lipoate-protein ligase B